MAGLGLGLAPPEESEIPGPACRREYCLSPRGPLCRDRLTGGGRTASQRGGGSWRYLYERLGDKQFQQLCNALLVHECPDVVCFPVGQKDGGRDAVRKIQGEEDLPGLLPGVVFQVKWTGRAVRDPVTWLDAAVREESGNIAQLVADGAQRYVLMTNVDGTSAPRSGTMDRLDEKLRGYERRFGVPVQCWWRADLDARVDLAPNAIKWAYADMLAGQDLIRYLIDAEQIEARDHELRTLLLKVIATQWHEDSMVKFKQVELDSHQLVDLFVDVEARRVTQPRVARTILARNPAGPDWLGGAAAYLVSAAQPLTLVRGEPGQGKSTLGQYLCQVHRAEFLKRDNYMGGKRPELAAAAPRLPLRVDLRDYARWIDGGDPFTDVEEERTRRARRLAPVEAFLALLLQARSGGMAATVETVHDILARFPMLLVLDGLDEVAQQATRSRVVREIDEFSARLGVNPSSRPQLVVTTRPNATGLAEPTSETFETIALARLSPQLRTAYLRRWADTRGIRGAERRALQRAFDHKSAEPHIAQLADNPMQLTILLYLLQRRGESVPSERTKLYTSYMETFLDREASKTPAVRKHRADLEEVTAFLGWHLQSLAEADGGNGRLATRTIKSAINTYLYEAGKHEAGTPTDLVEDLFTAVTDRVWALTSKSQGTFEFDVQPVREYFAAKYLYEFAGADSSAFPRSELLRQLIRRPYWLNTSRFYAGFANPNDITGLVEGLEEELEQRRHPRQVRVGAWALLSDGVFSARPRTQQRAAALFADDLSVRLINHALNSDDEVVPLTAGRGAPTLITRLQDRVAADPASALSNERMELAARLSPDKTPLHIWWRPHMVAAAGTPDEEAWLRAGIPFHAGSKLAPTEVNALGLKAPSAAQAALDAGIAGPADSEVERRMIRSILDGLCSDAAPPGTGTPSDLIRLLAPHHFLRRASPDDRAFTLPVGHADGVLAAHQRQSILRRLNARYERFSRVQRALNFGRGQGGTTSPWGNTAREIAGLFGPCWLAADIAVIGAASTDKTYRTGGDLTKDSTPLGEDVDYGRLLQDIRQHRSVTIWWHDLFATFQDPLSRSTWALALLTTASPSAVANCLDALDETLQSLSDVMWQALCLSSSRLGASGISRRLDPAILTAAGSLSARTALVLAHHAADLRRLDPLPELTTAQLATSALQNVAAWPVSRAAVVRLASKPDPKLLDVLRACGATATVEVDIDADTMPTDLAETVVDHPASYPLGWLLAAERQISRHHQEQPVADAAKQGRWFDDPPTRLHTSS